jgi:hypothetical protein
VTQGDRGRVGPASAEERDVVVGRYALGAPDDGHPPRLDRLAQPVGAQRDDLGVGVVGVRDETRLAAREAVGRHAGRVERDAQQRHGLALAGRDEHVHLPAGRHVRDVARQADQVVGLLAHCAHDHDRRVAPALRARHVVGDLADAIGIGDRRATELLDHECHEP